MRDFPKGLEEMRTALPYGKLEMSMMKKTYFKTTKKKKKKKVEIFTHWDTHHT